MNNLNPLSLSPSQYLKAIVAGLIAALAVLSGALDGGVTGDEWIGVASTFLATGYATFLVPNKATSGTGDPNLSEQDAGHGAVDALVGLVIVVICVVVLFKLLALIF